MADIARADYRAGVPSHYDPAKGIDTIRKAEGMETYLARARDADGLYEAVRVKLAEQRRFVLWYDSQGLHGGNRKAGDQDNGTVILKLEDLDLDPMTVSRWRTRLVVKKKPDDLTKFETTLQEAHARCVKVCEARSGHNDNARATNSGEEEWYTPAKYIEAARKVMGAIDLDPASNAKAQKIVKATAYFSRKQDGRIQEWRGRVWLNPPYTQPYIEEFIKKMVEEYEAGRATEVILLTHNSADTAWFHMAANACTAFCLTRGRIGFYNAKGKSAAPTQGQAFFYLGPRPEEFADVFQQFGLIARVWTAS